MVFTEEELIPISALAHFSYCKRRCALIHIEQIWSENLFTAKGHIMHERVHDERRESRGKVRAEYGIPLRSLALGLIGKADMVEFYCQEDGSWMPYPVEYKLGKPKLDDSDKIQLCAQAFCIEEMLGIHIEKGALFYGRTMRRQVINFDPSLRFDTEEIARATHELIASGQTPPPA
ncbi:MAG TPA: CRISPR-associated protein Cas4, partial [Syntrophorhabdus sp.]|nr:CRISPR-associated protein Cas4 [Syntrophorhabdus sp.]